MKKFIPYSQRTYKPLGPKSADIIRRAEKHEARNYVPYPFVVERSDGPLLYDPDGNKALDFLSGYSSILTHRNIDVIKSVIKQMREGTDLVSRQLYTPIFADFVELVTDITGYDRVHPKSDGGSACDSAISGLLMHGHSRKIKNPEVILTKDYFHGRTWIFGSNADFDLQQSYRRHPKAPGIRVIDDDLNKISEAVNENTTGIFIETHKGEGGPLFSTKEHFMGIKKIAKDNGIFFGTDEIQTGLGRCGYMMAWEEFGEEARPDFVTLGKALGGGIHPVSAVVGSEEYMKTFSPYSDGSTFGGNPIACAAGVASLRYIIDNDICAKAIEMGNHFVGLLNGVKGIGTEHKGALIRIDIEGVNSAKYACLEMLVGDNRNPRVFMKHGHANPEKNIAYTRISPPIGAMTKTLIDYAVKKTIIPVLQDAAR